MTFKGPSSVYTKSERLPIRARWCKMKGSPGGGPGLYTSQVLLWRRLSLGRTRRVGRNSEHLEPVRTKSPGRSRGHTKTVHHRRDGFRDPREYARSLYRGSLPHWYRSNQIKSNQKKNQQR